MRQSNMFGRRSQKEGRLIVSAGRRVESKWSCCLIPTAQPYHVPLNWGCEEAEMKLRRPRLAFSQFYLNQFTGLIHFHEVCFSTEWL